MAIAEITILLADDHAVMRDGVRMVLEAQPDFRVIGTANDGTEAVDLADALHPDLAVLDIAMPGMNGLAAAREIRTRSPETKVIFLSMHEGEEYLKEALRAGATGYVLKRAAATELVSAIRAVQRGDSYLDPALIAKLNQLGDSDTVKLADLTDRELEVLKLVAEGLTNRQIAAQLVISVKTVQSHRTNIMEKLDLHDRTDLVKYAIRRGMIEP
ncbi:response regulator transcription factor [Herpetosiphon gulosus]|uniref:Oxygen regulatory protein NreC n=1 Tax=Herpetosiphon gulosus TaxID=1973496 RepID=A0ABP9WZK6_9CHLR